MKKWVKNFLDLFGIEIHRRREGTSNWFSRASMRGSLLWAARHGFKPATVIDVGAANGTPPLYEIFPESHHLLIEPLDEFSSRLTQLAASLRKADFIPMAASAQPGPIVLHVHPDLFGSSVYLEMEDSDVNGFERIVPAAKLDDISSERKTKPPYLIKIDTQGSELDILSGAEKILQETEFVILEVSLFEFFKGGPQLYDCMKFMKDKNFVAFDIFDLQYRPVDGAMSQFDLAFVKERSKFRASHFYATQVQRTEQTKRLVRLAKSGRENL